MRCDLAGDPRVIRMAGLLAGATLPGMAATVGIDEFGVVGRLHAVWSWFDAHSHAGSVTGVALASLDRIAQCDGFARAMCAVGWLEEKDGVLSIPNFDKHNGGGARQRAQNADRARRSRAKGDECSADVTVGALRASRSERDEKRTREEKSREEKKRTDQPASAIGSSESSAPLGGVGGTKAEDSCAQDSAGWLAGLSVREALQRLDVREPALSGLCDAEGITVEAIEAEWLVVRQVAVKQGLRNPTGVMLHRLAQKFRVELGASARLTREEQKTMTQLAKVRADFERVRAVSIAANGVHRRGAEALRGGVV